MKCRQFLTLAAGVTGVTGAAIVAGCNRGKPDVRASPRRSSRRRPPSRCTSAVSARPTTATMLKFFKRHGVDHVCGYPVRADPQRGYWTEAELARTRELCEANGVTLDMVALPFLTSSHVDREKRPAIMLGQDPQRQRDVERSDRCIEACARWACRPSSTT